MISGVNGSRFLLSSAAKIRFESGLIDGAQVVGVGERHAIEFKGRGAEWGGRNLQLCDSLHPHRPLTFRTSEEAAAKLRSIGF